MVDFLARLGICRFPEKVQMSLYGTWNNYFHPCSRYTLEINMLNPMIWSRWFSFWIWVIFRFHCWFCGMYSRSESTRNNSFVSGSVVVSNCRYKTMAASGSCFQWRWFFPNHLFLESEHGQTLLPFLVTTSTSYNMSQNSHSQIQWWVQHLFFVDRILLSRTSQSNVRDINAWYVQTRKSCQRREFSAGKLGSWEVWKLGSPNSRVSKGNKTNARKDRRMTFPEAQHGLFCNEGHDIILRVYHRCSNNLSRFEGPTRTD